MFHFHRTNICRNRPHHALLNLCRSPKEHASSTLGVKFHCFPVYCELGGIFQRAVYSRVKRANRINIKKHNRCFSQVSKTLVSTLEIKFSSKSEPIFLHVSKTLVSTVDSQPHFFLCCLRRSFVCEIFAVRHPFIGILTKLFLKILYVPAFCVRHLSWRICVRHLAGATDEFICRHV